MRGLRADVLAPQRDTPGARRQKAEQGLEHRGLAGAVGADHTGDLACARLDVDAVQDRDVAVIGHGHVFQRKDGGAHVRLPDRLRPPAGRRARDRRCPGSGWRLRS
ncbi:hypothetical protein G6F31_019153 [Rhizopus arrhizus]|nr:hypothetical protein G6F31_019153 [Rhizopus arrhizus]